MISNLEQKVALVSPNDPFQKIISQMSLGGKEIFGIVLVVDEIKKLQGVISSGDILRSLARGEVTDLTARDIMVSNPISSSIHATDEQILQAMRSQLLLRSEGKKNLTRYIPLLDDEGVVHDVADAFILLSQSPKKGDRVQVYGLGFVGLTLAVTLSARGHLVSAIDTNKQVIDQLLKGQPHIFEPRLTDMLRRALTDKRLKFFTSPDDEHYRVVIISVGTPVNENGTADLTDLQLVCKIVGKRLQRGDLVMLRSTVPVGTTRSSIKVLLESESNLKAGEDFNLAFTPERTVQGQAMKELTSLPQIVGGLTNRCAEKAIVFWQTLTDSVVHVDSLEAAELVKLINNSFRDLSFAFANGVALQADRFNLVASKLIAAANDGYPRNPIPFPSPGVGGYCLTKDPLIYASTDNLSNHGQLSLKAREVNTEAGQYPLEIVKRFSKRLGLHLRDLRIVIAGMAFKGLPETNDLRGSSAISLSMILHREGCKVLNYDAIVDKEAIEAFGLEFVTKERLIYEVTMCDVFLILNNHPSNLPEGLIATLGDKRILIFDAWSILDRQEIEQFEQITYSTMGYMTPKRKSTK